MTEKPDKHPLSIRPPKGVAATGKALNPMTLIPGLRLSDAIKHGGRIYQLMVDSVRDYAIFMLDTTGHIASWKKGAQRIKGYTAEEIIGRHFSAFYTAEDIATDKPGLELKVAAHPRASPPFLKPSRSPGCS